MGSIFPTPYIVVEYIEGRPDFSPSDPADYVLQIATELTRIHSVTSATPDLAFLPEHGKWFGEPPAPLDHSLQEGLIREALESAWPLTRLDKPVLLHGDFWPGNLLWNKGQIAAIIDWEDAAIGDPLADVANCRLELLWALGAEVMNAFTRCYQSLAAVDMTHLP